MESKITVRFYDSIDDTKLKYAVIVALYQNKWVFCKHKERNTYEIPGGHRERGETIDTAAKRELCEETGALHFTIDRFACTLLQIQKINQKPLECSILPTLSRLPPTQKRD